MRHRKRGRKLGRNPKHQRALLRNLACALVLTERDAEDEANAPKIKGRIVTTLHKAKEVRPLVERCVTIARRALPHLEAAEALESNAERGSDAWRTWRDSPQWNEWNQAMAPALAARRRVLRILGDKQVVRILFDDLAPRFAERNGGYTRVLPLAKRRLGDAGRQAILEFVGTHDRVRRRAEKPAFVDEESQRDSEAVDEPIDVDESPEVETESVETESVETESVETESVETESKDED